MSKYMKADQQRPVIPKHKHCVVCSTPIAPDRDFCGPNCEEQFKKSEKKRKYQLLLMLAFPAMMLVLLVMLSRR